MSTLRANELKKLDDTNWVGTAPTQVPTNDIANSYTDTHATETGGIHGIPEGERALNTSDEVSLYQPSQEIITVGDGGDFSSLQDAISFLSRYSPEQRGLDIEDTTAPTHWFDILLLSGFGVEERVKISSFNASYIRISSEDATVPVSVTGGAPVFNIQQNAVCPSINVLFDADLSSDVDQVFRITRNSLAFFYPGSGVINAPDRALNISGNSGVVGRETIWSGAKGSDAAVRMSSIAFADLRGSEFNNMPNAGQAVLCAELSKCDVSSSTSSGCQRVFRCQDSSHMEFSFSVVTGTTNFDILSVRRGSSASGRHVDFSGSDGPGCSVESASYLFVSGQCKNNHGDDLRVAQGGVISAHGVETTNGTGTPSVEDTNVSSFNAIDAGNGIIWA